MAQKAPHLWAEVTGSISATSRGYCRRSNWCPIRLWVMTSGF